MVQLLDPYIGLGVVDLYELPQRRHNFPPAALLDAIVDHIDGALFLLLLQVRQELQSADQVIAKSRGRSMCFADPGVLRPAACLYRQYPFCLPPVVLPNTRSTPPFSLLSVFFSDPPDEIFNREQTAT